MVSRCRHVPLWLQLRYAGLERPAAEPNACRPGPRTHEHTRAHVVEAHAQ